MSRIQQYQSSFTIGEIDPLLRGRIDLNQYFASVDLAENVEFEPQGGFSRRPGLRFLTDLTADNPSNGVMLIPFEFSTTQNFMIVASVQTASGTIRFRFYAAQTLLTDINGSGNSYLDYAVGTLKGATAIDMDRTYYTQSADTLIIVNENFAPFKIVRGANNTTWTVSLVSPAVPKQQFTASTSTISQTLTASATSGNITLTAGGSAFSSSNVDQYVNVLNGFGRAKITAYTSATVVEATVEIPFFSTSAIGSGEWELESGYEDAWSNTRGWPRTCSFHEGRLYFGGSYSQPSTLFGSKVGNFFNFSVAEGLDDDAIIITLATDTVNAITGIRSGRDLQIFTEGGEFFIPQATLDPITPSNITVKAATNRGSKYGILPQAIEGGTLFIQRQGKAVREMLFSDVELNYVANNISLLSSHMLVDPQRMALRSATDTTEGDLLMIVNGTNTAGYRAASTGFTGSITAFTLNRSQQIVAPASWSTDGDFVDVAVDLDTIYTVVKRTIGGAAKYYLEVFDDDRTTDSSIQYFSGAASPDQPLPSTTVIGGLSHLQAETVKIVRDDIVDSDATVGTLANDSDALKTSAVASSGNQTLNGVLGNNDATANLGDTGRFVQLLYGNISGGWTTGATITITGTDVYGAAQTETLTTTSLGFDHGGTQQLTSTKLFKTITSINQPISSSSITLTIGVGTLSGTVTIGGTASSYVEVGLSYTSTVVTQPFEPRMQSGSAQGTRRRILEVTPILFRTQNLTINSKEVDLTTLPLPGTGAVPTFTGTKKTQGFLGYDRDAQITISQSQPVFMTVLALDYKVSVGA